MEYIETVDAPSNGALATLPSGSQLSHDVASRLRSVLALKGLTVNKVSKETERLFGGASSYFIPHNFCHNLEEKKTSPHVCQIFALSKISGYRMVDWFDLLGFGLREIPQLQTMLHMDHTTILCSRVYDSEQRVCWPYLPVFDKPFQRTTPVLPDLQEQGQLAIGRIENARKRSFLYAKIGADDAFAYPALLPGSIVRVDPSRSQLSSEEPRVGRRPLYLVEHIHGLTCCPVDVLDSSRILLTAVSLPYEQLEVKLNTQARILGTVDAEIRRLRGVSAPRVERLQTKTCSDEIRGTLGQGGSLASLLRAARQRSNLPFREAHELTLRIAEFFKNNNYAIAIGSLSDFETSDEAPRHTEKIISLCIIYGIDFWHFLKTARIPVEEAGKELMPRAPLKNEEVRHAHENGTKNREEFLSALIGRIEEVPLFLDESVAHLTDLPDLSVRNLYWWGRSDPVHHPLLANAVVLAVDKSRGARRIALNGWSHLDERPIYLVRKRNGRYVCGFCSVRRQILTVVSHPWAAAPPERLSLELEAEIVGQVVGVARFLS